MVQSGLSVKKVALFACLFAFAIAGSGMVEAKKKDYVLTLNCFVGGKLIFPQIELWSAPGGFSPSSHLPYPAFLMISCIAQLFFAWCAIRLKATFSRLSRPFFPLPDPGRSDGLGA